MLELSNLARWTSLRLRQNDRLRRRNVAQILAISGSDETNLLVYCWRPVASLGLIQSGSVTRARCRTVDKQ
jgi:hypothetical protein